MSENEEFRKSDAIGYLLESKLSFALRYGMTLLFALGILVVGGMIFVDVPDTLEGSFVLTSVNPPKPLVAKIHGTVLLRAIDDKAEVKQGQLLAVIDNLSDIGEVDRLDTLLQTIQRHIEENSLEMMPKVPVQSFMRLGELQNSYESFRKVYLDLQRAIVDGDFQQRRNVIDTRAAALERLRHNLQKEHDICIRDLKIASDNYQMDSGLFLSKSIGRSELKSSESARMQKQLAVINIQQSLLNNEISSNEVRQQLIDLQQRFESEKNTFIQSFQSLQFAIKEWKGKYLIISPIEGKVLFSRNIYQGLNVQAGEPLMYVTPPEAEMVCELLVPQINFGKVKSGQRAVIKFDSYNFEEYGVLRGVVQGILDIPYESKGKDGPQNFYMVHLAFKDGLITTSNRKIDARYGLTGTASIILDEKNLFSKLFLDRFKALFL